MPTEEYHQKLVEQLSAADVELASLPNNVQTLLKTVSANYATADQELAAAKSEIAERTNQLISSTAQAYSFLDTIEKGFIMCDTSGEIVLANRSLKAILASTDKFTFESEPSIDQLDELFRPDMALKQLITQCGNTKRPQERDNVGIGHALLHVYVAPLLSEAQLLGIVILIEDVTEQKMLDRSKDEFLSIASHELRTPLTAIRGNTALIKKYYSDDLEPDVKQMIDDIHTSSVRLIGIVNDFLDATAMEQAKIKMQSQIFEPAAVINESVKELHELCADKGIELLADQSVGNLPPIYADRERTRQVVVNLIGNAIKFTDSGRITIAASSDENFVYFSVTDTGTGMSEENQKLLFKKFQQAGSNLLTRAPTKGTGLGLYISKLIVELSGGRIWLAKSAPNEGSTFSFSLPKAKG